MNPSGNESDERGHNNDNQGKPPAANNPRNRKRTRDAAEQYQQSSISSDFRVPNEVQGEPSSMGLGVSSSVAIEQLLEESQRQLAVGRQLLLHHAAGSRIETSVTSMQIPVSISTAEAATASRLATPSEATSTTTPSEGSSDGKALVKPLSAYNFFFADIREKLLLEKEESQGEKASKPGSVPSFTKGSPSYEQRKQRLLAQHLNKDRSKRRPHRKSHGKVSFTELSQMVSARWKALPADQKAFYHDVAKADHERYERQTAKRTKMDRKESFS